MAEDGLQLRAGDERIVVLTGPFAQKALPALLKSMDGKKTIAQLAEKLAPLLNEEEIEEAVEMMAERHLLQDGEEWPEELLYYSNFEIPLEELQKKLQEAKLLLIGPPPLTSPLADLFRAHGIAVVREQTFSSLTEEELKNHSLLIYKEDRFSTQPQQLNELCMKTKLPWLISSTAPGTHAVVGPLFVPNETCCLACYLYRRQSNTENLVEFIAREKHLYEVGCQKAFGSLPAHETLINSLTVIESLNHIIGHHNCHLYNECIFIDVTTAKSWREPVLRNPSCTICQVGRKEQPWQP